MKIRWTHDSLRLRITPVELTQLLQGQTMTETLTFPGGAAWSVSLAPSDVTQLVSDGTSALLTLAAEDRDRLAAPDAEGVYFRAENGLRYLVEKDFPCVHPRASEALEPVTETFEAPEGFEQRKGEG